MFFEFSFKFVENFFDVPTVFVEQDKCPGGETHFVGEVTILHSVCGVDVDDLTNLVACGGFDEAIGDEAFGPRVSVVDEAVFADECGDAVALFEGAEVGAFLGFRFVPKSVVNAGSVPEVEDSLTFTGSLPKGFKLLTFEHFHIVFALFSVFGLCEVKVAEVVIAKVEAEEMSGGSFVGVFARVVGFCFGVKDGGFVVVAIGGEEVPVFEFFDIGESIAGVIGEVGSHELIHAGEVGEAASAFECLEKMTDGDLGAIVFVVGLEEIVAGFGGTHAAFDAEFQVVQVAEFVAKVLGIREWVALGERLEEEVGQGQIRVTLGHKNF